MCNWIQDGRSFLWYTWTGGDVGIRNRVSVVLSSGNNMAFFPSASCCSRGRWDHGNCILVRELCVPWIAISGTDMTMTPSMFVSLFPKLQPIIALKKVVCQQISESAISTQVGWFDTCFLLQPVRTITPVTVPLLFLVYPRACAQCWTKYRVALQLWHSLKCFLPFFSFGVCAAGAFACMFVCSISWAFSPSANALIWNNLPTVITRAVLSAAGSD